MPRVARAKTCGVAVDGIWAIDRERNYWLPKKLLGREEIWFQRWRSFGVGCGA